MKALSSSPRSINIPESLPRVPVSPLFKLIRLSDTSKLMVLIVVVVPFTSKSPFTVNFAFTCTSLNEASEAVTLLKKTSFFSSKCPDDLLAIKL